MLSRDELTLKVQSISCERFVLFNNNHFIVDIKTTVYRNTPCPKKTETPKKFPMKSKVLKQRRFYGNFPRNVSHKVQRIPNITLSYPRHSNDNPGSSQFQLCELHIPRRS